MPKAIGTRGCFGPTSAYGMPYSDCVSPKSRSTSWPAACAPTRAAESAAGGAALTSVFHGLLGGRTGQPPTIGPLVTTKGALVEHERPRHARRRWRPSAMRLRRLTWVPAWRAVAMRRPSTDSVCGSRPVTWTISVACGVRRRGDANRGRRARSGDEQRGGGGDGEQDGAHG